MIDTCIHKYKNIYVTQREREEKARQPERKPGPIANTRHKAKLRNAKRSQNKTPNPHTGRKAGRINMCKHRYTERNGRRPASRKQKWVQSQTHATRPSYATQSEAEPKIQNPHMGLKTGLNQLFRGPGKTAHPVPARRPRRNVRARRTQGRVAPARGDAELPERLRDEGGQREDKTRCNRAHTAEIARLRNGKRSQTKHIQGANRPLG
jgi:hypothetical protein